MFKCADRYVVTILILRLVSLLIHVEVVPIFQNQPITARIIGRYYQGGTFFPIFSHFSQKIAFQSYNMELTLCLFTFSLPLLEQF